MNQIEQLVKAEVEVQSRTITKNIEDTIKEKMADKEWVRR